MDDVPPSKCLVLMTVLARERIQRTGDAPHSNHILA